MEMLGSSSTIWTFIFALPLVLLWIVYRKSKFRYFSDLGVPGPTPSLFNGNYDELMSSGKGSWLVVTDWIKKYGPVFGYYRGGPSRILMVADHEMLKTILIKDFAHFSDRTIMTSSRKRLPVSFRGNLTVLTGDDWKRVRSTLSPTFTAKKMKMMSPKINNMIDILLSIVEEKCAANEVTDIYGLFQGLTLDVIGSCAFAMEVNCQRNPKDIFLENTRALFRNANNLFIRIIQMFPEFNFLIGPIMLLVAPNFKRGRILTSNLRQTIELRRAQMQAGSATNHADMIQLMLEASENKEGGTAEDGKNGHGEVQKKYLTEEEMIGNSFVFLLAGFETTANCLGFTAYLLAKYPEIQQRLYEEIVELFGHTEKVDYEQAQKAAYLEMVIEESLRLFPPVTSFVTRVASETVNVNGQIVPEGTGIEVPVWYLQHDPAVWDQPYEFVPERFSEENKPSINPMSYMPFGAGPRNCIGMRFALLEVKIAFIRILKRYRLDTCEMSEPEIQLQQSTATINPRNGVFVRLSRR
ncbi:hypothetical protein RvY_18101 [Ramazzottius varieornatus]|uniref:Cytochrome P450 n=1 Tax=Ramazzottius varieornatus TaxID=947166 RepID=A0A1D1WAM6_RAMVA|nr:hypothetical protein RvY_18101 [Ramazzottius varieornatus]